MTTLEIWNAALALLPHDRTVEAEDEDSTEALRCRQHWDAARRHVLGARNWGWLAKESPACTPFGGWSRPPDALRIVGLVDAAGRKVAARAANGLLVASGPDAGRAVALRFIPDNDRPEEWPPAIIDAVVAELAARICPVLTDNAAREASLRQSADQRLAEAGEMDANEVARSGTDGMSFIRARR